MSDSTPKFFGQNEIEAIVGTSDEGYKEVSFKGGKKQVLSEKMIAAVITDSPIDLTELRKKESEPVVGEILKVLHSWNVKIVDVSFILKMVDESLDYSIEKANEVLFGEDRRAYRLHAIHSVLVKGKEQVDNNVRQDKAAIAESNDLS